MYFDITLHCHSGCVHLRLSPICAEHLLHEQQISRQICLLAAFAGVSRQDIWGQEVIGVVLLQCSHSGGTGTQQDGLGALGLRCDTEA